MVSLKQKLLVVVIAVGVSLTAFGQKGNDNNDKRPPKDPPQVVVKEKDPKPPPPPPKGKGKP